MQYCDTTLESPEANLALDEALLDFCEEGAEPVLRFWSPTQTFVVVGYANRVAVEVNVQACEESGIPILRRCSGGGTVLQARGCLNYSLVLRIESHPELRGITSTNEFVMETTRAAVARVTGKDVRREGHTDLAIEGRKFCGNAQRRKRHCLLFHGCLLLDCDLSLIEAYLQMPSKQPDYRRNRRHSDFVRNLGLPASPVKTALIEAWAANTPLTCLPLEHTANLVNGKYSNQEWNRKF